MYQCRDTSAWQCVALSASTSSVSAGLLCTSLLRIQPSPHSVKAQSAFSLPLRTASTCPVGLYVIMNAGQIGLELVSSHPDFGDWLLQAFVVNLPQGDGVKLSLVQVRHGSVACLLTQRFGCFKGVLEIIPTIETGGEM